MLLVINFDIAAGCCDIVSRIGTTQQLTFYLGHMGLDRGLRSGSLRYPKHLALSPRFPDLGTRISNTSSSSGAICVTLGTNLSLESSAFNSNKATWSGALMISGSSSVSILNSNFSNNIGMVCMEEQ